jgi:hypothetical protein
MKLTFAVEPWDEIKNVIHPFWVRHYLEIARDQDRIPLDPDWDKYDALDATHGLLIITARTEWGELKGYVFAFVGTHIHYKSTMCAFLDLYWLEMDARQGWNGVQMFRETERIMRELGIQKIFGMTKAHKDVGLIFQRLGWDQAETAYTKWIA